MSPGHVLVVGGSGLLGTALCYAFERRGHRVSYTYRKAPLPVDGARFRGFPLEITDSAAVRRLREVRPTWMIHTASLKNVDYCETHPDEARTVNVQGAEHVAEVARDLGCGFVYVSTNDIFSGLGPFSEEDSPAPLNVYARTKLEAEARVRAIHPGSIVIRTTFHGWHYDPANSFSLRVLTALRRGEPVRMATDQYSSIIASLDLAEACEELIRLGTRGTFHVACRNALSRYGFARSLANVFGLDERLVHRTEYRRLFPDFDTRAKRPLRATLAVGKAEGILGHPLPTIRQSLVRMRETAAAFCGAMRIPMGP